INVKRATPTITWPTPADITYGTALGSAQLDATSSWTVGGMTGAVAGTFSYSPAAGTVLHAGTPTLSGTFTPPDTTHYTAASAAVPLTVHPAVLTVTANNASMVYGATTLPALSATITGFVNGDTGASLTTQPTLATTATVGSHVSGNPYRITASGA